MPVKILKVLFIFGCCIIGGLWGWYAKESASMDALTPIEITPWFLVGSVMGSLVGAVVLFLIHFITQEIYERMMPTVMAVILGLLMGHFLGAVFLTYFQEPDVYFTAYTKATFILVFGFVGMCLGLTHSSNWEQLLSVMERNKANWISPKLVDTSVIIDGRISDICDSGFMEGTLLVPRFVLGELQHIADSPDELRRAKGRRGLDILKSLQGENSQVKVEIIDDDPRDIREVDAKLVRLGKKFNAKILTNDYNLNKVAQIEGVTVMNINDLANALKPMVLPDERMEVKVIKEGKEITQGVGYLDDGTMIVVDGGRAYMGRKVEVVVTSVLQTAAGRMIFTRFSNVLT